MSCGELKEMDPQARRRVVIFPPVSTKERQNIEDVSEMVYSIKFKLKYDDKSIDTHISRGRVNTAMRSCSCTARQAWTTSNSSEFSLTVNVLQDASSPLREY